MELKARKQKLPVEGAATSKVTVTEEQIAYAEALNRGMKVGLFVMTATFIVYITGMLAPRIPVDNLSRYWGMSVHEYLAATGIHAGWSWLGMLSEGDYLNFVGIAIIGSVSVLCYLTIIPIFFRKKDKLYGFLAILEVLVLSLAASGLLKTGGH